MKPVDIKDNTYIDSTELRSNDKDPKFKVGDHVRISTYKIIFAEGYTPKWSEKAFVIKKVENGHRLLFHVPWLQVINDLIGVKIIGTIYEKELQKTNQQEIRIEKVIRKR